MPPKPLTCSMQMNAIAEQDEEPCMFIDKKGRLFESHNDFDYLNDNFPVSFLKNCFIAKIMLDDKNRKLASMFLSCPDKRKTVFQREGFDWTKQPQYQYILGKHKLLMHMDGFICLSLYEVGFEQGHEMQRITTVIKRFLAKDTTLCDEISRRDQNSLFLQRVLWGFLLSNDEKETCEPMASRVGFIYLVSPGSVRKNVFKVGMTTSSSSTKVPQRVRSYGKQTKVLLLEKVAVGSTRMIEREILSQFQDKFKLVQGNEYFEGDPQEMMKIIKNVCKRSE